LVDSLVFLSLWRQRECLAIYYWDHGEHFLRPRFFETAVLNVPSSSFNDESEAIGTVLGISLNLFDSLLGNISLNVKLVQLEASLIGSNHLLDGGQIALRVEESTDHDDSRQGQWVVLEQVELLASLQKIDDPELETSLRRVGQGCPGSRHSV